MKKNFYASECDPRVNTRIMRVIEENVCKHRNSLPNGWRVIIKFQRQGEEKPYYHLDLQSNQGGGDYALTKMQMLESFPMTNLTGADTPDSMIDRINRLHDTIPNELAIPVINKLRESDRMIDLPEAYWEPLQKYGLTHWYGGLRVPYDILLTQHKSDPDDVQDVVQRLGEIRIAFSGAKEWMDVYFALQIFSGIQTILGELWENDQIWYNLRKLQEDPVAGFWLTEMEIPEAPRHW